MKTKKVNAEKLEQRYLDNYGNFCPFCGSDDIEAGHMETDANIAWRPVECNGCNKEWTEEYSLSGCVFNLDDVE